MKDFELTKEQKAIVEKYNKIVKEMRDNNIVFVRNDYDGLFAFNGENIEYVSYPEDKKENDILLPYDDGTFLEDLSMLDLAITDDEFCVTLK